MIQRTIIIAEAGVNHNGSVDTAKELIDVAAAAGADYVKFQSFHAKNVVSSIAKLATYQRNNLASGSNNQLEMVRKLELSDNDHETLVKHCTEMGIKFLSTAFDDDSMDMLHHIGMDFIKIPSGEITNLLYLKKAASYGQPIVMSTGMACLGEIEKAISVLLLNGLSRDSITVLHCNTEYPTPMQDVNLKAMLTIRDALNVKVGYSDHTLGIEVPIAAVALGANVIEKHFTLDRSMPGPDHKASLEPNELKDMVQAIRNIELALSGNGLKEPSKSEIPNLTIARRSIHTAKLVPQGEFIAETDLIMKRPGDGISPMEIDRVVGKRALRDLPEDHCLDWSDFI